MIFSVKLMRLSISTVNFTFEPALILHGVYRFQHISNIPNLIAIVYAQLQVQERTQGGDIRKPLVVFAFLHQVLLFHDGKVFQDIITLQDQFIEWPWTGIWIVCLHLVGADLTEVFIRIVILSAGRPAAH